MIKPVLLKQFISKKLIWKSEALIARSVQRQSWSSTLESDGYQQLAGPAREDQRPLVAQAGSYWTGDRPRVGGPGGA
jgi:hypothetical protein